MKKSIVVSVIACFIATMVYAQPTSEARMDGAYKREMIGTREIIPYDFLR